MDLPIINCGTMDSKADDSRNNDKASPLEREVALAAEQLRKVVAVREELTKETDRGCALMAASFLENELKELLDLKLVGTRAFKKELFDFNGPLGSFSARIKMAFALGFISKEIKDDLDLIRRIRNEFGHRYEPVSFQSEPINGWILELKQTYYKKNEAKPRSVFNNTVLGVLASIHAPLRSEKSFTEKTHISIPWDEREKIKENVKKIADLLKTGEKKSEP